MGYDTRNFAKAYNDEAEAAASEGRPILPQNVKDKVGPPKPISPNWEEEWREGDETPPPST